MIRLSIDTIENVHTCASILFHLPVARPCLPATLIIIVTCLPNKFSTDPLTAHNWQKLKVDFLEN